MSTLTKATKNYFSRLEYVAHVKEYTQYGFITTDYFEVSEDYETDSFVLQIKNDGNNGFEFFAGSDEDYAVYDEADALFTKDEAHLIHLECQRHAKEGLFGATDLYLEWLKSWLEDECEENFNIHEYLWTYEELPAEVQAVTTQIPDAYYYVDGSVHGKA
ncbi:hypothetical protein ACPA0F_18350 [Solibacillus silvestris]